MARGQPHQTFVKICGITTVADARMAVKAGANGLGFMFAASLRRIPPSAAARIIPHVHPSVRKIGVFVDASMDQVGGVIAKTGLDGVQLYGRQALEVATGLRSRYPALFVAVALPPGGKGALEAALAGAAVDAVFVDPKDPRSPAGPSEVVPAAALAGLDPARIVVAGGLNPENVGGVVRKLHPWGVDVSRGVESRPGRKDPVLVHDFIRAVRLAEAAGQG